jgi:hypothetical protein
VSSTLNLNELLNYDLCQLFSGNGLIVNQLKKIRKLHLLLAVDGPQIFGFDVLMLSLSQIIKISVYSFNRT